VPPAIPDTQPRVKERTAFRRLRDAFDEQVYAWREFLGAARHLRVVSLELEGCERHTGEPLRVFYVGHRQSLGYVLDKLYREHSVSHEGPKQLAFGARRLLDAAPAGTDLLLAELPWPYFRLQSHDGFLRIPGWVVQKLPLADRWADVLAGFRKNTRSTDLRKVRKYELDYRLTSEPSEIQRFYRDMYQPYAERRFGELALIDSESEILAFGTRGVLLEVLHLGERVAGVILFEFRGSMHFLWIGLPDHLEPALFDAAFSGIYYFSILHAYLQGCHEIDLSYTRPLLSNGIYRYKRKWGSGVHDEWRLGELWLRPLNLTPAVESALARNPWIVRAGDRLVGKVLLDRAALASPGALRHQAEHFASPGLDAIELCSLHPIPVELREAFPEYRFRELGGEPDPARAFCHSTSRL